MSRTFKLGVLAAAVMAAAPAVQAYEAGDFIGRVGVVTVAPDASSDPITNLSSDARVDVDNDTQLGLTLSYMLTDQLGLGVLAATPFSHDIKGDGDLAGLGKLAETKQLPPTITLQYFPMPSGSKLQPYVGAGVNYTVFFDEQTAGALAGTDIKLDDSFGLAAEVGLDYMITENIGVNAAVWWIDIDTEAKIEAVNQTVDVEIDPLVYMVGLSYKF
ncbi:outer membrane protein OmpW [Marinobacter flavimaris]|uniref:Outer membrane protein OmpW n=1 Tax=Marinobacter flavimaris TaxID=262076 RepID=A0A3D8H0P7_9GAMM|nr:OmpW family outer membrane protein [Marinobacter flavimaris]MCP4065806.1 outer membrane beta-barrel protein [Gammaproteobacteria bacterium]PPI79868.1 outer membrane protein OmpW [Marinobacter flavimaris]RDU40290.1 outer membrane protein OmpW [Marinobacter flavimaris]